MNDDTHDDLDAILNDPGALVTPAGELPLVLATNWELLGVMEGRELTFTAEDGTGVRIRLYNVDELLAAQKAAADDLGHDPGMTRAKAIELCMPLGALLARKRSTL